MGELVVIYMKDNGELTKCPQATRGMPRNKGITTGVPQLVTIIHVTKSVATALRQSPRACDPASCRNLNLLAPAQTPNYLPIRL